jgi:putative protease
VLEERERAGEYFPIFEGEDYTAVLSSKDLCMIDNLEDMKKAGVDALKIEGRMKSLYYVAMTTRAYRKQIDALEGKITKEEASPFVAELYKAAHREFATGFYYNKEDANKTTTGASNSEYELMGTIGALVDKNEMLALASKNREADKKAFEEMHPQKKAAVIEARKANNEKYIFAEQKDGWQFFIYNSMNKLDSGTPIEFVGPDVTYIKDETYQFIDSKTGMVRNWISHGHECLIYTSKPIKPDFIVRAKTSTTQTGNNSND